VDHGGDYVSVAKHNQPTLRADMPSSAAPGNELALIVGSTRLSLQHCDYLV
jgi:hypothetical protein